MKTVRLILCVMAIWVTLFFYIDENNELTELRRLIPDLQKEVKALREKNIRLEYEIERFENPSHLMELTHKPEFSHLKPLYFDEIIILEE